MQYAGYRSKYQLIFIFFIFENTISRYLFLSKTTSICTHQNTLEILFVRAKFDVITKICFFHYNNDKKHMVLCHQMLSHRNESSSEKGYFFFFFFSFSFLSFSFFFFILTPSCQEMSNFFLFFFFNDLDLARLPRRPPC